MQDARAVTMVSWDMLSPLHACWLLLILVDGTHLAIVHSQDLPTAATALAGAGDHVRKLSTIPYHGTFHMNPVPGP